MYLICPNCGKETEHEIISYRETKRGKEYILKCKNCGYTYSKIIKDEKMIEIKTITSLNDKSTVQRYTTFEEDILSVGEEIKVNGVNSIITAIDTKEKRVSKAVARDIKTLWVKRFDRIRIKVSVNRREKTIPAEIMATPDEEFYIGDILELNGIHAVIHKIKTNERFVHNGGAAARDIVRIYAKEIREMQRKY